MLFATNRSHSSGIEVAGTKPQACFEYSPCITRARGGSSGHWLSWKQRNFDFSDFLHSPRLLFLFVVLCLAQLSWLTIVYFRQFWAFVCVCLCVAYPLGSETQVVYMFKSLGVHVRKARYHNYIFKLWIESPYPYQSLFSFIILYHLLVSSHSRKMNIGEICKLMGLDVGLLSRDGLSDRQLGLIAGNAVPVPMLQNVLRSVLRACSLSD